MRRPQVLLESGDNIIRIFMRPPMNRYHLIIDGTRTTVSLDILLSNLLAVKLNTNPVQDDKVAHLAARLAAGIAADPGASISTRSKRTNRNSQRPQMFALRAVSASRYRQNKMSQARPDSVRDAIRVCLPLCGFHEAANVGSLQRLPAGVVAPAALPRPACHATTDPRPCARDRKSVV